MALGWAMQHLYMAVFVEGSQNAALEGLDCHFLSRGLGRFLGQRRGKRTKRGLGNTDQPRKRAKPAPQGFRKRAKSDPLTLHEVKKTKGLPVGFLGRKQG